MLNKDYEEIRQTIDLPLQDAAHLQAVLVENRTAILSANLWSDAAENRFCELMMSLNGSISAACSDRLSVLHGKEG